MFFSHDLESLSVHHEEGDDCVIFGKLLKYTCYERKLSEIMCVSTGSPYTMDFCDTLDPLTAQ